MNFSKIFYLFFGLFAIKFMDYVHAGRGKRMVGGNLAEHSKFPYTVFIYRNFHEALNTSASSHCTGSILDNYHVISSAHCFIDNIESPYLWRNSSYLVISGATDLAKNDYRKWVNATVQRAYVPKIYDDSLKTDLQFTVGDIAVLRLNRSLNLMMNDHLQAVQIPQEIDDFFIDNRAVVSGYGANLSELSNLWRYNRTWDYKLRFANTAVLNNSKCQSIWDDFLREGSYSVKVSEEHICAQIYQRDLDSPEGMCVGDSGGPLIRNRTILIGVANTVLVSCKENEVPAVYTRVSAFKDFIKKVISYDIDNNDPKILAKHYS